MWSAIGTPSVPVSDLRALDGCYRGQTMFESLAPQRGPWVFRIADGVMFDRDGKRVASVGIGAGAPDATPVTFSPGILIGTGPGKSQTLEPGATVLGSAYIARDDTYVAVRDDWGHVFHKGSSR